MMAPAMGPPVTLRGCPDVGDWPESVQADIDASRTVPSDVCCWAGAADRHAAIPISAPTVQATRAVRALRTRRGMTASLGSKMISPW